MKTYDKVIKTALDIFYHKDNYAYFYGAKGQVLTDPLMDALIAAEPEYFKRYTKAEITKIKNFSRGKVGYDCSGFIGVCVNDKTYSGAQWSHCKKNASLSEGVAGSLLYKPGHIGLDIGYGYFLHFPSELHSCEIGKITDFPWELSGRHTNVSYKGSSNK